MKKKVILLAMLLIIATSFAMLCACDKDDVDSIYKPVNISYDGARVTWDKVKLADYYTVSINGGEEKRVNTNVFVYDAQNQEFDATIRAYIKNKGFDNSQHFTPLATIEELFVADDGQISWEEVAGATAYRIAVNGVVQDADVTNTYFLPTNGNVRVKVRPVVTGDASYFSLWSEEKQIYINSVPTNINYDGEKITWNGNSNNYLLSINGEDIAVEGNQYNYSSGNLDFELKIKAVGNHTSTFDSAVVIENFYYLEQVRNINVENGILHWGVVENAEGYNIKINGVVQNLDIKELKYDDLTIGTQLEVEIRPYNKSGKYFSTWSETKNIYILSTPIVTWNADLELDGESNNNFVWEGVNASVGYVVEVDYNNNVQRHEFPVAQRAFGFAYDQVGTYKVRVKAVAETGGDYYDSKFSKDVVVERLAAPTKNNSNFVVSDSTDVSKGFTVNYNAVPGATAYQLYKDSALLNGKLSTNYSITDADVVDDAISAQQTYNYYIRSMGGVRTVNGATYVTLPCLTRDALSFQIVVQAMPTDLTMAGYMAQWSDVAGNNGYAVNYGAGVNTSSATVYNLSTLKAGSYDLRVCTKGNGGQTLASNYTAPLAITRLEAPANIKISYGAGDGQLEWDTIANAKGYQVFLDQSEQALDVNAYDNMYQYIKESGTVLHMVAVANYFNELKTVYYMTSEDSQVQQFIRLAAPVFPDSAFANSVEMVWNVPENINTAEYTPTYEVYLGNVMQTGGVQNGNKFNIQYLEGGMTHTFYVKAVGNDTKYLDSKKSNDISIYKLATPVLYIENNQYCWNGVVNASSYVLEIDGVRVSNDIHVSGNKYSYTPNYTSAGTHTVKLFAVGDGYNTINSNTFVYEQEVKVCVAPEIEYSYSSDSFVTGGSIYVNITKESANTVGYLYEIAGSSQTTAELIASKVITDTGEYFVRVKAIGGTFDAENNYYIESQFAGGNNGYKVVLLAYPTVSTFSINSDGAVKWATISGAYGYDYQIAYDEEDYGSIAHTGTASLNPIANFKSYKKIRIKVRASGNGSNVVNSAWVEYTWVNPNL